jgi:gluconate kinase
MDEMKDKEVLTLIDQCSSLPAELRDSLRKTFEKDIIENVLQKEAVMKSMTQDHDDFLNALSIAQKMAIREFIIYMSNIHAVEKLAKKALECYWAEMDV